MHPLAGLFLCGRPVHKQDLHGRGCPNTKKRTGQESQKESEVGYLESSSVHVKSAFGSREVVAKCMGSFVHYTNHGASPAHVAPAQSGVSAPRWSEYSAAKTEVLTLEVDVAVTPRTVD